MKRIKIMLLSIALLAVVGGALAFKAKFNTSYCYTTSTFVEGEGFTCLTSVELEELGRFCSTTTQLTTLGVVIPEFTCYTETIPGIPCNQRTDCSIYISTKTDN